MRSTSASLLVALTAVTPQLAPPAGASGPAAQRPAVIAPQRAKVIYDAYILGPSDSLQVELLDIPELSGTFAIGPDGTMYLPRLRALYVEGLTVEELRYFLTQQFKAYVKNPQLYVKPVGFRPVRVYVGGEINRPGFYTISGSQAISDPLTITPGIRPEGLRNQATGLADAQAARLRMIRNSSDDVTTIQGLSSQPIRWPTLFDALRAAQGVTPFSNLAEVQVVRKQPLSAGGGKARATVNFLQLVSNGDESVNIRLFDGDVVNVSRSSQVLRDQLLAASRTNLSPDFIQVYVSGRVKEPGPQSLPQGATLNQAIASAGGAKLLRGQVEFLRFSPDGATDRRLMSLNLGAQAGDYKNPVLMNGDVVRVNDSIFSATVGVLNEVTGPAVGIYSVYSLFKP
jgi:polysaccharide export outer membrane protein